MPFPAPPGTYATATEAMVPSLLASGEETLPRWEASTNAVTGGLANQAMRLTYFTARKTEAITQVRIPSGGTAAGATPTLCRVGIYTIAANGDGTLTVAIANDTTLWAAGNTDYLRSLTATLNKVAGQRYAMAWLCVTAAAAPTVPGLALLGGVAPGSNASGRAPRTSGSLSGQADLPATFTEISLGSYAGMNYAELVP